MNIKSGRIEGFEQYSQFSGLKEFNSHLEMWLSDHKQKFSKGELIGLKRLARFSAKIPGVCNAKIGTMLKAIHEEYNENGISRSTFKRMIQKAIELGIITVYETERKNGSQSSNLYIFNRFPTNEPPNEEKMNHHKKTNNLSETNNQITKRNEEPLALDFTYVSDRVPQPFVQLVKYFFPEAKTIEEFWHMTQIAAYRNNREKETDTVLDTAIHSFKQMIRQLKSRKTILKPIAYYYGILDHKLYQLYIDELAAIGFRSHAEWLFY
jgi:N-acetylglutamate synthase-like GNAT family acetyltransferase